VYEVTLLNQQWQHLQEHILLNSRPNEYLDRKQNQIIWTLLNMLNPEGSNDLEGNDLDLLDSEASHEMAEEELKPNVNQEEISDSSEEKEELTLYEKWLKQLKNNPIIAVLLLLFLVVAGAGQIAKSFNLNLLGPSTHTILIEGAVTDSLSQPIAQVRVKIMRGEKVLGSPITNPDGSFRYSIELEKASRLNLEFSKGAQTFMNRTVAVDVQLDTFVLPAPFILIMPAQERQEQVDPPSAQPPAVPTTNKTFAIFFDGEIWNDSEFGRKLSQEVGFPQVNEENVAYRIDIVFPRGAIFEVTNGVKYNDELQPELSVNGEIAIRKASFKLQKKYVDAQPRTAVTSDLKKQLNQYLSHASMIQVLKAQF
ncbi:MAG: carboxypeptidase-like regulatory domain-containing protein, partial [Bacteroidota bacterium]